MIDCIDGILVKVGLRRLNLKNLAFFYYPIKGASCYLAFGGHTLNPYLLSHFPLFPRWLPVASIALAHANVGLAAYLFNSRHLRRQKLSSKLTFSVFGSAMFNLGSILSLAILRHHLPECLYARTLTGLLCSSIFLCVGYNYVSVLDQQALDSHVD